MQLYQLLYAEISFFTCEENSANVILKISDGVVQNVCKSRMPMTLL